MPLLPSSPRGARRAVWTAAASALLGLLLPAGAAALAAPVAPLPPGPSAPGASAPCDDLRETWGIEPVALRLTASDYMLDFRYRVVDARKAERLLGNGTKAFLVDAASHETLTVPDTPKVGQLRNHGKPETGKTYFILFGNQERRLSRGDLVSIVIGNALVPELTVE